MKLTLTEPKFLKESVSILSELVNDVKLNVTPDHIQIVAFDPANVAMVNFRLLSSAFAEYELGTPEEVSISLDNLKTVLKRAKPADSVILSREEGENKLKVELVGDTKRTFNIPLINLDSADQKVPNLNFSNKIEMPSIKFDDAVEDVGIFAESVALKVQEGKFLINSENNLSDAKVEMPETDSVSIVSESGDAVSKYSMDYLKKIIKGSKLAGTVSIEFNNNYPLKVSYNVTDRVSLEFILAPRVSND